MNAARSAAVWSRSTPESGALLWKTFTLDEPKPLGKNAAGVQSLGTVWRRDLGRTHGRREAADGVRSHRQPVHQP